MKIHISNIASCFCRVYDVSLISYAMFKIKDIHLRQRNCKLDFKNLKHINVFNFDVFTICLFVFLPCCTTSLFRFFIKSLSFEILTDPSNDPTRTFGNFKIIHVFELTSSRSLLLK